jgi:hypothetical protein
MQKVNAGHKKFAVPAVGGVRIIQLHGRSPQSESANEADQSECIRTGEINEAHGLMVL